LILNLKLWRLIFARTEGIMKLLKLLAVMTLACSAAFAAEVSFEASVDRLQTAFEDPVQLELVVRTTDPDITTRPLMPPRLPGFSVGGSSSSVSREGDTIIRRYTYELRPAASGEVRIPALQLEYTDSLGTDTLSSQPIAVQVGEPVPEPALELRPGWNLIGPVNGVDFADYPGIRSIQGWDGRHYAPRTAARNGEGRHATAR
jgi:hypothetical protein